MNLLIFIVCVLYLTQKIYDALTNAVELVDSCTMQVYVSGHRLFSHFLFFLSDCAWQRLVTYSCYTNQS